MHGRRRSDGGRVTSHDRAPARNGVSRTLALASATLLGSHRPWPTVEARGLESFAADATPVVDARQWVTLLAMVFRETPILSARSAMEEVPDDESCITCYK
jgi:hypothetical protein